MPDANSPPPPCARIEDYALIGDCETAALVGLNGSIDWLCWPRFDSSACFAALLGEEGNGRWLIAPSGEAKVGRRYRPGTLILETRWETPEGTVLVTDLMPPRGECSDIVRFVTGESGRVSMRMVLALRFDYGRTVPWVTRMPDGALRAIAGPDMVMLRTPVETHGENLHTVAEFTVAAGESVPFVLTYRASHLAAPLAIDPNAALADTEAFWADWMGRCHGPTCSEPEWPPHWTEAVHRSLIVLKALTYAPTGGIVAAATTSLPEWPGGPRNWDYRLCWLRDSTLTLFALLNAGYTDEAAAWRDWLIRAIAGSSDQVQIMYGLAGERRLEEQEIDWLKGFANSKPVRIGNKATEQLQLDVFGEVMGLLHQSRVGGLPESDQAWSMQKGLLRQLDSVWREPDNGIWEMRGPLRHFTFSKAMAWLAYDRCILSAEQFGLDDAPVDQWRATRDEIHAEVCQKGFDAKLNTFTQSYGDPALDASLLLLPLLGFLPADDPRMVGTVEAIEKDLLVNGFVLRYHTKDSDDGLPPGEGSFLACSFWLVEAYAAVGRTDDAVALFERLLAIRNDVGILAEEYDPVGRRQLGNTPQAFSHVGLVNAAHRLAEAMGGRQDAVLDI